MKLAEALLLRADMQKKLASLRERVVANAVVQENDKPHEEPDELLLAAFGVARDLEALVVKIHATNMAAKLADGRTLTQAIAARDTLTLEHALLVAAIAGTRKEPARFGVREIARDQVGRDAERGQAAEAGRRSREEASRAQRRDPGDQLAGGARGLREGFRVRVGRRHQAGAP